MDACIFQIFNTIQYNMQSKWQVIELKPKWKTKHKQTNNHVDELNWNELDKRVS